MATVAELQSCDGFSIESPRGLLGWVEETWLDDAGHPGAVAVRTPDGRRALLLAEAVEAVDPDSQEVLVARDAELLELDAPQVASVDGTVAASWRTTGRVLGADTVAGPRDAKPASPALAAARATTVHVERPFWQIVVFALTLLASLVAFEIGLAFLAAYLDTGHWY